LVSCENETNCVNLLHILYTFGTKRPGRVQVELPVWMLKQCQSFYMKLFQLFC